MNDALESFRMCVELVECLGAEPFALELADEHVAHVKAGERFADALDVGLFVEQVDLGLAPFDAGIGAAPYAFAKRSTKRS